MEEPERWARLVAYYADEPGRNSRRQRHPQTSTTHSCESSAPKVPFSGTCRCEITGTSTALSKNCTCGHSTGFLQHAKRLTCTETGTSTTCARRLSALSGPKRLSLKHDGNDNPVTAKVTARYKELVEVVSRYPCAEATEASDVNTAPKTTMESRTNRPQDTSSPKQDVESMEIIPSPRQLSREDHEVQDENRPQDTSSPRRNYGNSSTNPEKLTQYKYPLSNQVLRDKNHEEQDESRLQDPSLHLHVENV